MTIGHDKSVLQNNKVCKYNDFDFCIRKKCAKFVYRIKNNRDFILPGTFFVLELKKQTN